MYQVKHQKVRDLVNFDLLLEDTTYHHGHKVTTYYDKKHNRTHAIAVEVTADGLVWNSALIERAAPLMSTFIINRTCRDYDERPAVEYNVAYEKLKLFTNCYSVCLSSQSEMHRERERASRYNIYLNDEMVSPGSIRVAENAQKGDVLYIIFFDADKHRLNS